MTNLLLAESLRANGCEDVTADLSSTLRSVEMTNLLLAESLRANGCEDVTQISPLRYALSR
jgi:hypothetical protein